MNIKMRTMMKNDKMFNADSNENAILVHSLHKNVSNNRSMKNTFLTTMSKVTNATSTNSIAQSISKPMKHSNLFLKTLGVLSFILITATNVWSQCNITFPANSGAVPAQGSTIYFTDCDLNGSEVVSWTVPTASSAGTCGAVSVNQGGGPSNGSSMSPGNYVVNYTAQAVDISNFSIVNVSYSFNVVVQSANPTAGGLTNAQTICAGTDPAIIASAVDGTQGSGNGTASSITYQWQSSLDNATWVDIAGATSSTYDPSILTATTYYRRRTVVNFSNTPCSNGIVSGYTPSITITVIQNPSAGLINASQILCTTLDPAPFSNATSGAGTGAPLSYQWYSSSQVNSGYSAISGASNSTYDSPSLSSTTFFQRKSVLTLTSGELCYSVASNTIMVGDTTNPVITCPSNQIVAANNNTCNYVVSGTAFNPTATDDCSVTLSCDLTGATIASNLSTLNGESFNPGLTTVTWTATDAQGNSSTCSYTVTVQKPVVANQTASVCSDIVTGLTLGASTSASAVVTYNINSITTTLVASAGSPLVGNAYTNAEISNDAFTNTGNSQSTVVYNITPVSASGCEGSPFTATITVNPTPALSSSLSPAAICSATTFAYTATSSTVAASGSTVMTWSRATVAGITEAGTTGNGNVSETLTNTTNAAINVTYVYTIASNGCTSTNSVVVSVKPTPTVDALSGQTLCNATSSTAITFASAFGVASTTYAWSNSNTSIGLAASGTTTVPVFTATNATNAAINGTITVTPTADGCSGSTQTATITVNPTPALSSTLSPTAICSGSTFAYTATSATVASSGSTVMTWSRATVAGITESLTTGTGNISETLTNTTNAPINVTYVYTITSNGCSATNNVVVTVNPTPTVDAISAQTLCTGVTSTAITFASTFNVTGTTYAWSNSNTSIGLAATGATSVPTFTATNTTNSAISATITVTPTANGCSGSTQTATITVNPTPALSSTLSPTAICSGSTFAYTATSATVASSGSTVMTWSRATVAGITESLATGTGNISEVLTNTTNAAIDVTYVYTITSNGCSATNSVVLSVSPLPVANAGADQIVCNGANVTLAATGSNTYAWNNGVTDNVAFVASNSTNAPVTTTYTLTVTNSSGCVSTDQVDVTVNPTPTVNTVSNQSLCASTATTAVNFASTFNATGTTYSWTNSSTAIGLAASGTGDISSFTATNSTTSPIVATITVTPNANGCAGTAKTFTITVQPIPTVNQYSNITYCGGIQQSAIVFSGTTSNTQYAWTSSQNVGFFSNGIAQPTIGDYYIDPSTQVVSTVTVTPEIVVGGLTCSGSNMTFTVTVNPTPSVNSNENQTVCNGSTTSAITFTGSHVGNTYTWSNNTTSTGLAASGTGDIASFTATNTGSSVQTSTITVTPTLTGCSGTPRTISLNVNPTPTVTQPVNQTVCAGTNFAATNFTGAVTGTNYSWSSTNTAVGLAATGSGNIAAFAATNSTNAPISTTVTVTPTFGETGTVFGLVAENGTLNFSAPTGTVFTGVSYASYGNPTGSNGNYTNGSCHSNTSQSVVEGLALGQTTVTINATDAVFGAPCAGTQSLAVVLAYSPACSGTSQTFTLTVNPVPSVTNQSETMCSEGTFTVSPTNGGANVIPTGTTYSWSAPTVTGITGTASGTNASSISGTLTNTTNASINVVYTVTPSSATTPACAGTSFTVTVTVAPTATVTTQTQTICSGSTFTVSPTNGSGNIVPTGTTYSWSAPTVTGITGTATGSSSSSISGSLINTTSAPITVNYTVTPTSPALTIGSSFGGGVIAYILQPSDAGYVSGQVNAIIAAPNDQGGASWGCNGVNLPGAASILIGSGQQNTLDILSGCNQSGIAAQVVDNLVLNGFSDWYLPSKNELNEMYLNKNAIGNFQNIDYWSSSEDTQWDAWIQNFGNGAQNAYWSNGKNHPYQIRAVRSMTLPNPCSGTPFTVSIIVNPAPNITPQTTTTCSEGAMAYSPTNGSGNIVPTGTTYSWTFADNSNVTGEAIGTNQNNIGQTLTNTSNIDQQVVYTVTPSSGSCVGSTFTLTATVNPKPLIADKTQTICSGNAFTIAPTNGGSEIVPAGTQYTWTVLNNTNVSGDVNEPTAQNTVSQTLTNSTNVAQTVVYTVTPVLSGCNGNPFTVTVTVNPVPVIVNYALNGCSGTTISSSPANGSGNLVPSGTTYTWSLVDNSFVLGEQAENTGQTSFSQSLVNLYTTSQLVNYTVTPSYLSCAGNNFTIAVTVNELPNIAAITGATNVCTGLTTQLASATTGGTWTSSNTAVATVNASGVVTGVTVGNVTISYSVTNANGCTSSVSASVNVNIGTSATITSAGSTTFCQGGSVTLTANSGATYLWSNGAQTQSINVTSGGPYTVTVTNAGGCSITSAATTVTVNALPTTAAITGSTSLCVGTTTNLATTSVNPTWSSSNTSIATVSATGVVTGVSSGSATISYGITDANGCSNTASSVVVVNPLPTATIAAIGSTTFCQGGSVTLLAANAPSGSTYSYVWKLNGTAIVGATANTYVANASGNYSVTITANGLCQATSSATTVTVNSLPILAASTGTTSVCAGSSTALSNATAAGTWSSSNNAVATINSANGLVTGVTAGSAVMTYTFTNANGCSSSTTTNFTVNPLPTATITASGSTTFCQGGSVTLTANTASSYQWSNGATTASITVNASGSYTVTITNANGCSAVSVPTTVTVNTLPSATITANGPTTFCQGGNVTLVASSGASYLWSNGAPTQTISVTAAGTYSVTVTSAAGCTATSTGTIVTVNALPVATINPIGSTTFCQGSLVTLIASAGTSYLWSSGETTQGIIASVDGPYTVTVTNANGCSATSANTNVVVNPLPTVAAITGLNDVCVGSTTVLATTSIGGVWSSSNTAVATVSPSGVVTGITAGNAVLSYSITNVNGCTNSVTAAMTVNAGTTATISASGTTTFCAGGSVTLTASSGSSYEWNTGSLNPSITVSASGSYYVNVTNALGCTATSVLTQVVVNPLPVVTAITGSTEVCIGNTTQLANTTNGGVWSSSNNNIATVDANGLVTSVTAGSTTITYTVTNANGCTSSVSAVVNVNALPTASISANGATTFCAGGSVTLVATTGTSYLWNNGQYTQSITVDTAGTYFATVTNASGCSANTNAITVTVNALPTAVVTANGPTAFCQGNNVLLTATGGTSYIWSTGETTQSILVSTSENIQVDVTNSNGCTSAAANTIVTVLPVTVATITANGPTAICLGSNVTLSATAGTGLTYLWSNGVTTATTQNITVSNAGTYTVTVTNASGCSSTAIQTVTVNANPAVTVTANGPTLFCQGGSVTLTASGAASYEWNTGDFTSSITVTTAGSYFVVGTSAAGCQTTSATTVVTTSTIPTVAAITGANNVCEGGTINLTSSTINGTWTSANNFIATVSNTGIVTGQNAGTTTITYTVTNGACSNAVTAVVNVLNNPVVPIITASGATTMCPGGTVILFASNGASYQWSNGPLTPFITVNQSGDYAVTVTNASGCSATSLPINVFIGDNTNPVIVPPANITMAPNFGCDAIGVNLGNPTATDNCSVATVSHNAPAIFPLGLTTVTWTVVDGSGNTSTATQFVNVVDNILPTINVNDITVVINDNGSTTITFSDVDNGTTDNCGIASMTLSQYTFGCSNIGDNNITVTVTDNNGNVATTTILVTVVTSGTDTDNDGTLNACDSDDDGDGINDLDEVVGDTDGDGIPNSVDADDDGDGISTIIEGTDDIDGDGISNYLDSDSDGDGISDDFEWDFGGLGEPGQDCDNDGVYDFLDTDLCGPVIPEAFTPNGNGFNDNFVIPGIEGYTTRSVSIYSRYGTLVYETSEYNNDWDGTLLNTSTQVPDGTYYYIFTFDNGVVVNGYVYINRVQK